MPKACSSAARSAPMLAAPNTWTPSAIAHRISLCQTAEHPLEVAVDDADRRRPGAARPGRRRPARRAAERRASRWSRASCGAASGRRRRRLHATALASDARASPARRRSWSSGPRGRGPPPARRRSRAPAWSGRPRRPRSMPTARAGASIHARSSAQVRARRSALGEAAPRGAPSISAGRAAASARASCAVNSSGRRSSREPVM